MHKLIRNLLFALAAVLILAGCVTGGDGEDILSRADAFIGGAPTDFSGPDSGNTGAEAEAADMVSGRTFDLTPSGFTLSSGPLGAQSDEGDYAITGGTLDVDGDTATMDLDVSSANPNVTGVSLVGSFSLAAAQSAILNPGRTFDVDWDVGFSYFGFPIELQMTQTLTGTDFVQQ